MSNRIAAWLLVFLALTALPASSAGAQGRASLGRVVQLFEDGKNNEVIAELQRHADAGETLSSLYLWYLGGAYYEVRDYRGVLATADAMDRRVAAGDRDYGNSDLSVYPDIFRAQAALDLGSYEDAVRYGSHAREQLKPPSGVFTLGSFYPWQLAQVYGVLGLASAFLGHDDEARKYLDAIRGVRSIGVGPEKFLAMARIQMALKEYDKALQTINDPGAATPAILVLVGGQTYFRDLPKLFIRAKSLYETGSITQAKAAYDQLLTLPQVGQFGSVYWVSLYDRARIARQEGDTPRAIELLKKAIETIEQQRSSIDSESGRIGFVGDKQAVYQLLISLLVAKGEGASAFEYVERSKARALVDMLAGKHDFSVPAGGAERVRDLLAAADSADVSARAVEATAEAQTAKRSLAIAKRQELYRTDPELSSLVTVNTANASAIQALLAADETLVEYFYSGDELDAFVVTRDSLSSTRLDVRQLESEVAAFRRAIQDYRSDRWKESSAKLYARLIAPIRDKLHSPNILVVPHGVLHYLPFNALHDGNQFLIEGYSIRLLPAATVLRFIKPKPADKPGMLLAFGNPDLGDTRYDLAFAQKEAEDVARTMPNSRVLVRREATKTAFRKYASDFLILHVASHGDFDAEKPLASSLLLAPDGQDDGRLTVSDLYSMRVDADLVTLSACETGLGKVANGDDVVGLTRGFLYAGTRAIIASLWQVDDRSTDELMTAFYKSLSKGLNKQQALRSAQTDFLRKQPHPFYWAAFQLTGNP